MRYRWFPRLRTGTTIAGTTIEGTVTEVIFHCLQFALKLGKIIFMDCGPQVFFIPVLLKFKFHLGIFGCKISEHFKNTQK
jgi:hypothetical protein